MLEGNRVAVWAALVILAISSTVRSQENELFQCPDGKPRFFFLFFKKNTGSYHCMVQRCSTYTLSCVRYQVISLLLRFFRKEFAATPTSNQWQQLHKNRKKQLGWTCNDEKKVERGAGNICATTTTTTKRKKKRPVTQLCWLLPFYNGASIMSATFVSSEGFGETECITNSKCLPRLQW